MDIKNHLVTKKPRRSDRLCCKEKGLLSNIRKADTLATLQLGYFDLLPIELRFNIFQFLTIESLSFLTLTSKAMRNLIEGYRVTRSAGPHRFPYKEVHGQMSVEKQAEILNLYHKLGLLMKRSTCLYATKDRLKIINEFLTRMACCNNLELCKDQSRCISLLCFGKFLHTVIAGWDDSECQRVFEAICQHMCMPRHVKAVVSSKPGSLSNLEVTVRHFFRRIFLDPCMTTPDKAFWITRILKPWPIVFQARLLYILYAGHFSSGVIQWHEMSETTPVDKEHSTLFFGSISSILQVLHLHSTEWSSDEIICIIDEMTDGLDDLCNGLCPYLHILPTALDTAKNPLTCRPHDGTPEDWLIENVAGLLLACGECIATKMLVSKAINGRYLELASIIASLCLVCVKHNYSLTQVMSMLDCLLGVIDTPRARLTFLNRVLDTFRELVLDTHEFTDADDGNDNEFFYHVSALTEFTKELAQLAYKQIIPH